MCVPGASYINNPIPYTIFHVVRSLELEICQEVSSYLLSVLLLKCERIWCVNLVLSATGDVVNVAYRLQWLFHQPFLGGILFTIERVTGQT